MMRLLLMALGAWVAYRVAEENQLFDRPALLPPPGTRRRAPAARKR